MLGEGAGLGYGLRALLAAVPDHLEITILGDNLPVIRLGAATGSLRTDGVWAETEGPLMETAYRRWRLRWTAVRRQFNMGADALATEAVMVALRHRRALQPQAPPAGDEILLWWGPAAFRALGFRAPFWRSGPNCRIKTAHRPLLPMDY